MIFSVKLTKGAKMPSKAHKSDAGFDLYAPETFNNGNPCPIYGGESCIIDTGTAIKIPDGYCGLLVSKSGLNVKNGLTSTGLIYAGYTGNIVVKLYNQSNPVAYIEPGQKISQIVILPIPEVELALVSDFEGESERGADGFGSSGKF